MSYLEELLPEFRKGARIRRKDWDKDNYLVLYRESIIAKSGNIYEFYNFDFLADDWEFYQEPESDWYIIDHKCLCKFWNKKGCEVLGFLKQRIYYKDDDFYTYISLPGAIYTECRPVRRDEVTFYEDREK